MKLRFKLLAILIILFSKITDTAQAQTDTIKLTEIIINEARIPFVLSEKLKNLEIIEPRKINALPSDDIGVLLEGISGVDVRERGLSNIQADISINGSSYEQIIILIDGVKISDPQTGHHSFNIPIDLDNINRLEVYKGPGARVFGLNAATGAINIITTSAEKNQIRASLYGGQHQLHGENFSISNIHKKISQQLTIANSSCNGYIKNTDFNSLNVFYNNNYSSKFGNIKFTLANSKKNFGANSFYSTRYPDQYEQIINTFVAMKSEFGKKLKITPILSYRRNQDRFELFRESTNWYTKSNDYLIMDNDTAKYIKSKFNKSNYYYNHNYHLTHAINGALNVNFTTKYGRTALGGEHLFESILSNVLGDNSDSVKVPFEDKSWFTKACKREISSFFVEHSYHFKKITISSGLFTLYNQQYNWNVYGGADITYNYNNIFKIFASLNQSVRLPTFTDLYYKGADRIGNPDLKPEKVTAGEIGLKYNFKNLTISAMGFYRESKNTIDWVRPLGSLIYYCQNHTQINTMGINANLTANIESILNQKFIKQLDISYTYSYLDKKSDNYESLYALDYLKTKIKIGIFHQIIRNLNFSYSFIYQDRAGSFYLFDKNVGAFTELQNYHPFTTLDAKLNYKFNKFDFYVSANNLFNEHYFDYGNIEMPGRWIKYGIKFTFDY